MSDCAATIGKHLRRARTAAGLTQGVVAAKVGQSIPTISAYESGDVTPPGDTLLRLALVLRLDLSRLARACGLRRAAA